jgi:biuret amidohydrolase
VRTASLLRVAAQPYAYRFEPRSTALIVIDMQRDFVEPGGFGEALGNDVRRLGAIVPTVRALLDWARGRRIAVLHTREGHRPDLADCPPAKLNRGEPSVRIGAKGPMGRVLVDGEPGNDIVAELTPLAGESVIVKPGKGAFWATPLDDMLRWRGITHLILAGVTTEVCVQTTMREANDRGYECLLLEDCCGATDAGNHAAAVKMVKMQNGVFGAVSQSRALLEVLS